MSVNYQQYLIISPGTLKHLTAIHRNYDLHRLIGLISNKKANFREQNSWVMFFISCEVRLGNQPKEFSHCGLDLLSSLTVTKSSFFRTWLLLSVEVTCRELLGTNWKALFLQQPYVKSDGKALFLFKWTQLPTKRWIVRVCVWTTAATRELENRKRSCPKLTVVQQDWISRWQVVFFLNKWAPQLLNFHQRCQRVLSNTSLIIQKVNYWSFWKKTFNCCVLLEVELLAFYLQLLFYNWPVTFSSSVG